MYIKTFENYKKNENDQSDQIQYQFRDIDGGVYYKRKKGDKLWEFTTKEDYENNFKTFLSFLCIT